MEPSQKNKQSPVSGDMGADTGVELGFTMTSLRSEVECWSDAMLLLIVFCPEPCCVKPSSVGPQRNK